MLTNGSDSLARILSNDLKLEAPIRNHEWEKLQTAAVLGI